MKTDCHGRAVVFENTRNCFEKNNSAEFIVLHVVEEL